MTTLNVKKIQGYKNITKSLLAKTNELAQFIESICDENGINSLLGGKYTVRSYNSQSCQYTDLCYTSEDQHHHTDVCLSCDFVDSSNKEYIRNGQLNAWYYSPTRDNIKIFINDIESIFADIEKQVNVKTDKLDEILSIIA